VTKIARNTVCLLFTVMGIPCLGLKGGPAFRHEMRNLLALVLVLLTSSTTAVGQTKETTEKALEAQFIVLDRNAVLLTYTATQDAVCGGKKAPTTLRVAVNYVKRDGKWLEAMYMQAP